jgi:hypothetical protein
MLVGDDEHKREGNEDFILRLPKVHVTRITGSGRLLASVLVDWPRVVVNSVPTQLLPPMQSLLHRPDREALVEKASKVVQAKGSPARGQQRASTTPMQSHISDSAGLASAGPSVQSRPASVGPRTIGDALIAAADGDPRTPEPSSSNITSRGSPLTSSVGLRGWGDTGGLKSPFAPL